MLLSKIEQYWTGRAEGYSEVNRHELATGQDRVWFQEIRKHLPEGKDLKILDVGTGPGFFAILLAKEGYEVTAVDYTEAMLRQARENAGALAERICFRQMDAQHLDFPDGTFDVVISRNLTWNLEELRRQLVSSSVRQPDAQEIRGGPGAGGEPSSGGSLYLHGY